MFSKEEVTRRINEFKGMLEKEKIMSDSDGDTIDLTVHGEVVHMWFNFMGVESTLSPDEVLRLTDGNDAKWYALSCYLDDIIHDLKHENETLKAQIEELETKCDQYRVQIDDMEAEEMAPSMIDGIDMEGGNVEDLIKYHAEVAGGSDEDNDRSMIAMLGYQVGEYE